MSKKLHWDWQKELENRKILRYKYFKEGNPNTVRNNLIYDLNRFISHENPEEIKNFVEKIYHPDGENAPSALGNSSMFQTLIAICDQLFVYSEYFSFTEAIHDAIKTVVPDFAKRHIKTKNEVELKRRLHVELKEELEVKKRRLEESQNKKSLFLLIDGEKTLSELWRDFNEPREIQVSKQYISQMIKELEINGVISLKRLGKAKIPTQIVPRGFLKE